VKVATSWSKYMPATQANILANYPLPQNEKDTYISLVKALGPLQNFLFKEFMGLAVQVVRVPA
jgi:hypothetical protein